MDDVEQQASGRASPQGCAPNAFSDVPLFPHLTRTLSSVDTKFGNLDNFVDDYKVKQQERANSSQFIWMSEDGGMAHTIFVLLEEPGSSTLAVVIGSYIQVSPPQMCLVAVRDMPSSADNDLHRVNNIHC